MLVELEAEIRQKERQREYELPNWEKAERMDYCQKESKAESTGGTEKVEGRFNIGIIRRILPGTLKISGKSYI